MAEARSRTEGARFASCRIFKIALSERCFCWSSVFTRAHVAAMPFFQTFSADSSHPGTCRPRKLARSCARSQPASMSAPRVMSPLMPEKQSKYASFMGVRRRAVLLEPQKMCPSGAFRYYRRPCGVSNPGWRHHPPPPTFPDLRNLRTCRTLQLDLHILMELHKIRESTGRQRQASEAAGANSPKRRI